MVDLVGSSLPSWIAEWLAEVEEREGLASFVPAFCSTDVRQDGWRVCVVDVNRFPQGMNNVEPCDFGRGVDLLVERLQHYSHIHVVEEDYGSRSGGDDHPYYRHLASLLDFLRLVARGLVEKRAKSTLDRSPPCINVTSSPRLGVGIESQNFLGSFGTDGESHTDATDLLKLLEEGAKKELRYLGAVREAETSCGLKGSHLVWNVLNTSYPNDLEIAQDDGTSRIGVDALWSSSESCEETRRQTFTMGAGVAVDYGDPRLYNSMWKHELFSFVHIWLVEFQSRQREAWYALVRQRTSTVRQWDAACEVHESRSKVSESAQSQTALDTSETGFVTSTLDLEARFDRFPGALGVSESETCHMLAQLIALKLEGSKCEAPWFRVFVKDDLGSNGVGVLSFSAKDLVSDGQKREEKQFLINGDGVVTLSHGQRKALRGRSYCSQEQMSYVLQEGIPTSLLKYSLDPVTGEKSEAVAQLEVVLMFAFGRIFNYFLRESALPMTNSVAHNELCTSLNVAGVAFVRRKDFETLPEYQEAFAQVRHVWWRYELAGRLAVLAMARQAKAYQATNERVANGKLVKKNAVASVNTSRIPCKVSASEVATSSGCADRELLARPQGPASKASKLSSGEAPTAFARRMSGQIMRKLNQASFKESDDVRDSKVLVKELQLLLQRSSLSLEQMSGVEDIVVNGILGRVERGEGLLCTILKDALTSTQRLLCKS